DIAAQLVRVNPRKVGAPTHQLCDGHRARAQGTEFGYLLAAARHRHAFTTSHAINDLTAVVA
ncbi:MAG TPA: hypothetical protein VLA10_01650, partial [Ilumatobacter sp.]|nr:hypothetical protein [Ilumatobacter sp.]